jgi:mycothiol synthase
VVQPVRFAGRLDPVGVSEVLALAAETGGADGVHPLSEDAVLRLRGAGVEGAVVHLMSRPPGGGLAGYAQLDLSEAGEGPTGELFVHPEHRRHGLGRELLDAAVSTAAGADPAARLRIWAHGDDPGARVLADRAGFIRARVLWQMRRPLTTTLPDVPMPAGVTLRAFRPGTDDHAWLAVNGRAFDHHPEQGRWTADDLRVRMAEPWFDPAGFLLAVDGDGKMLGFHWTKVHPAAPRSDGTVQGPIGEIYVLGVDPGGHRRGLGAALSVAGLRHLRDRGLADAMLYVDESNAAAVALYTRLGFTVFATDVSYQRSA